MAAPANAQLEMFPSESGPVVRLTGRGAMRESRAFHQFASNYLDAARPSPTANPRRGLTLDLSLCERLDSTFLGCLVDLHKRFNRETKPIFTLSAPAEVIRNLLGACRLDRLLPCRESAAPNPTGGGQSLDIPPDGPRELGKHVMICHRQLAEQDCPSKEAYARVAEQLEKELSESQS